jgi:putative transposase
MPRQSRLVVPGIPHHVTQRGNRRQNTFFSREDYDAYRSTLARQCQEEGLEIWAYCFMPNHIHLIAVPPDEKTLAKVLSRVHQRYTNRINKREGWKGFLWQGRFASFPMDEVHAIRAARYIELNPVRAGMLESPGAYPWSSAPAHLSGRDDGLVKVAPILDMVDDWSGFLGMDDEDGVKLIRKRTSDGRPLGKEGFVEDLEMKCGRSLRPGKRGRQVQHRKNL